MGRFDDAKSTASSGASDEDAERDLERWAKVLPVGSRCQVDTRTGEPTAAIAAPGCGGGCACGPGPETVDLKRGVVKYVGLPGFKPGVWIGIEYDEPMGKHDGSVNGERYFEARPKHGAFVRPQRVEVGDFPEEDPFADLEEM